MREAPRDYVKAPPPASGVDKARNLLIVLILINPVLAAVAIAISLLRG